MTIKQDLTTVKSPARNQQYQSTAHCCGRKKFEVFSHGFNRFNSSTGIVLTPITVVSKRKKAKPAFSPPLSFLKASESCNQLPFSTTLSLHGNSVKVLKRMITIFATLNLVLPGPFNKPPHGSCQLTP